MIAIQLQFRKHAMYMRFSHKLSFIISCKNLSLKSISTSLKITTFDRNYAKLVGSKVIANYYNSWDPIMFFSLASLFNDQTMEWN